MRNDGDDNLGRVIGTILRHDAKVTSYKIALIRAINDVALSFPDAGQDAHDIAIPLRYLAEFWLAYYWPFVDPAAPIYQGPRPERAVGAASDMAFREALTALRGAWEQHWGMRSIASDGFTVQNELRVARRRAMYPDDLLRAADAALLALIRTLQMPIRYAGPKGSEWSVFPRPKSARELGSDVRWLPGTEGRDLCLLVRADLWKAFQALSVWVEALCLHEWCLFTEHIPQEAGTAADRGDIYRLLTQRPGNRRPLTWERNQVDILLMEGKTFTCPWTEKRIAEGVEYDLDHLVPVSIHPINEIWNLVPSDPRFNSHVKRDRLPTEERLARAEPHLSAAYALYESWEPLRTAIWQDAASRFSVPKGASPAWLATEVHRFISLVADSRNIARFT